MYNNYYNPYMCCKCCNLWRQYYNAYMINSIPMPFNYYNKTRQSQNAETRTISIPPLQNWQDWKQYVEKLGGQWIEEGSEIWENIMEETKKATNILGNIERKFKPCIPQEGYSCIEYKVLEKLPVLGAVHQDIVVRVCYPTRIVSDVKEALPKWLEDSLKKAAEDAAKAFISSIVLTAWGAFVGSIEAGIYAAINAFSNSLIKDLPTLQKKVEVEMNEIIPSVYMRKHSLYIPYGNNCAAMYKNYGQSSAE